MLGDSKVATQAPGRAEETVFVIWVQYGGERTDGNRGRGRARFLSLSQKFRERPKGDGTVCIQSCIPLQTTESMGFTAPPARCEGNEEISFQEQPLERGAVQGLEGLRPENC